MADSASARGVAGGNIYDLGYRRYDGQRLGRQYAARALFSYSFLAIWGIGRSTWAKVFPIGLAVIASIPALVLLGVAALVPAEFEVSRPERYFGLVSIVLPLFCAVVAPELIGRDARHRTLSLYFSRALSRFDYVGVKLLALILSLFVVIVTPQILLQLGNAVAAKSLTDYASSNLDLLLPILGTSLVIAVFIGTLALAIAMQTSRRAFSTGAVITVFAVTAALGGILVETLEGGAQKYSLLVSPLGMLEGVVYWAFGAKGLENADLGGVYYFAATLLYTAVALGFVLQRTRKLAA